jgi:hypothetical protein
VVPTQHACFEVASVTEELSLLFAFKNGNNRPDRSVRLLRQLIACANATDVACRRKIIKSLAGVVLHEVFFLMKHLPKITNRTDYDRKKEGK